MDILKVKRDGVWYPIPAIIGEKGFSPVAAVTKDGHTVIITITDETGTTTQQLMDGEYAVQAAEGSARAAAGSAAQALELKTAVEQMSGDANSAKAAAQLAAQEAQNSESGAQNAAAAAEQSAQDADASAVQAAAGAEDAQTAKNAATESANNARTSEENAAASAQDAADTAEMMDGVALDSTAQTFVKLVHDNAVLTSEMFDLMIEQLPDDVSAQAILQDLVDENSFLDLLVRELKGREANAGN